MASVVDIKFVDESENFNFEKSGESSRPRREKSSQVSFLHNIVNYVHNDI